MADEYQTTYDDSEKYENKRGEGFRNTYGDTEKSKNTPADEFQTTYEDVEKNENKSDEEFQTAYADTQSYDSKPEENENKSDEQFQTTYTDTQSYYSKPEENENKSDEEFKTAYADTQNYDNKPEENENKPDEGFQTTFIDNESKAGDEFQSTFNDEENYNNNPIDAPKTTFTEESATGGYGESSANTFSSSTEAKNDYKKEDENNLVDEFQTTVPKRDEMTGGYNESFNDHLSENVAEPKHDFEGEEKQFEQLGVTGSGETSAYALDEEKKSENDLKDTPNYKIEEENAATATVGAGESAFNEMNEAKEENDETQGKKKKFYIF